MSTRMSSGPSIARDLGDVRTSVSLTLGSERAKASYRQRSYAAGELLHVCLAFRLELAPVLDADIPMRVIVDDRPGA
jgi:hypothetical protein